VVVTTLLEVARIDKPHGLGGDVVVSLISNVESRLAPGSVLTADTGELVVVSSRPHQHRWIVAFEGIDDVAAADALRGTVLRAPPADDPDDPDALWVHELIGASVVDTDGAVLGVVVGVLDNPASDLLELDGGGLIPLRFVVEWDGTGRLVVDPPDGLLD
jgi:16S rRNA processing protein RimM